MKVLIYLRTSTDEQEPENQLKDIVRDYKIEDGSYELFIDKQSAWKDNKERENFEILRKRIKASRDVDLYVWDWDRIFRNRKKLKEFFKFCSIHKCRIHSARQKFYEDFFKIPEPFNEIMQDLFLNLLGWMAEDESTKKSDRVKAAVRKKHGKTVSRTGKKWGRPLTHTNKKKIVWGFRDDGKSLREISKITKLSLGKVHEICSEKRPKKYQAKTLNQ